MTTGKKKKHRNSAGGSSRELVFKEPDTQVYARVTKMLGNGRVTAECDDGVQRLCKIRGSMRKRDWVKVTDIVLVALRGFQDDKADLVCKYDDGEVRQLTRFGELVGLDSAKNDTPGNDDNLVVFGDSDSDYVDDI